MDNAKLDEWIGKSVAVQFREGTAAKQRQGECTLESADERGIMLNYHDAQDLSKQVWFFPWHRIEWVHRLTQ